MGKKCINEGLNGGSDARVWNLLVKSGCVASYVY
jgi:hypothetical protein